MAVTQHIDTAASPDHVWVILDGEFGDISTWAARMLESSGDPTLGELGGRQVVTVEYGAATETLYARNADERMLGYQVTGPTLPPPISDVRTEWRVTPTNGDGDGDGGVSRVSIRFLAEVNPPEMQPMLEETLRAGITPMLDELRHYAESGQPHPNKTAITTSSTTSSTTANTEGATA